ncbi:hypothetical protein [Thermicanus aegyptius]|uniref:hypothetical protein n=1 Tax=Thermicanus aegyptius TaxID=94009 RepID=UPI0003FC1D59|nr:hypothetical protein [Thermicanus aegyptius]
MKTWYKIIPVLMVLNVLLLSGCVDTLTVTKDSFAQEEEWQESAVIEYPTTVTEDGQKGTVLFRLGNNGRFAWLESPLDPFKVGNAPKIMWLFWGKEEELKGVVRVEAVQKGTNKKMTVFTTSNKPETLHPFYGANHSLMSNVRMPDEGGLWRFEVYIDGKPFGYVVVNVQE